MKTLLVICAVWVCAIAVLALASCGGSDSGDASAPREEATMTCSERTATNYESEVVTYCAEDYPTDFQEGQNSPAAQANKIAALVEKLAGGRLWFEAFRGAEVVTDTILLYFGFKTQNGIIPEREIEAYGTVPATALCNAIVRSGFLGIDRVRVLGIRVGAAPRAVFAECP